MSDHRRIPGRAARGRRGVRSGVGWPGRGCRSAWPGGLEPLELRVLLDAAPAFETDLADLALPHDRSAIEVAVDGADDDGDVLAITAASDDPQLGLSILPLAGGQDATLTIDPAAGFLGLATITVTLDDTTGNVVEQSFEVTLTNGQPALAAEPADQFLPADNVPLTVGVEGTDADGDPLTITAASDDPDLTVLVPAGNRFARMNFVESDGTTPIGSLVFELFEGRMPANTERFITLSTTGFDETGAVDPLADPFWTDVLLHRVVPDFVIQSGDAANGDGTGSSPLGTFDGQVDASVLGFAGPGVLAWANRGSDPAMSDSQFFVTASETSFLDPNFAIIGQLTSGQAVYDDLINRPRDDADRPEDPPLLQSVEILDAFDDATLTLTSAEGFDGRAEVTITVDDGHGGVTQHTMDVVRIGDRPSITDPGDLEMDTGQTRQVHVTLADDLDAAIEAGIHTDDPAITVAIAPDDNDGDSLRLTGNTWRAIAFDYTVTADTILAFDFSSSVAGERQGIGFDADLTHSGAATDQIRFDLYGTQEGGPDVLVHDFNDYEDVAPGIRHYEIPVGTFFTGAVAYMTFVNDDDINNSQANGLFSHVQVYEAGDPLPATINFNDQAVLSYGRNEDKDHEFTIRDEATHTATITVPPGDHKLLDVTITALEAGMAGVDVAPAERTFQLSTLGAPPTIADPGLQTVDPGGTVRFFADIQDDSNVELDVTLSTDQQDLQVNLDPATFEITIGLPPDQLIEFEVTIGAVERGFPGREPTTRTFTVSTVGLPPVIGLPGTIFMPVDRPSTFDLGIADDSGLPLTINIAVPDPAITFELAPETNLLTITPLDANYRIFDMNISVVEEGVIGATPVEQTTRVVIGAGLVLTDPDAATYEVFVADDLLYVANGTAGLRVFDISDPEASEEVGQYDDVNARDVEVVGTTAFVAANGGRLLALDVTDPANIVLRDDIHTAGPSRRVIISDGVAFVSETVEGVGAYDVSNPDAIRRIGTIRDEIDDANWLALKDQILYVVDVGGQGGVDVVDVSDPRSMRHLRSFLEGGDPVGLAVDGNRLYVTDAESARLFQYDIRRPARPRQLDRLGGLDIDPRRVVARGDAVYVAHELGVWVIDASLPGDMFVDRQFAAPSRGGQPLISDRFVILPFQVDGVIGLIDLADLAQRTVFTGSHTVVDDQGVTVRIRLGGAGFAVLHTRDAADGAGSHLRRLRLHGTGGHSSVTITTTGGDTTIEEVDVRGFLRQFIGRTVDLAGDFVSSGFIGKVVLDDVLGPSVLSIGFSYDRRDAIKVQLDAVANLLIGSTMPIKTLEVGNWLDPDGDTEENADGVFAPGIDRLNVDGAFEADLGLSGSAALRRTLGRVRIGAGVRQARWQIVGPARDIRIDGTAEDWTLEGAGALQRLRLGAVQGGLLRVDELHRLDVQGPFSGDLEARYLRAAMFRQDVVASTITLTQEVDPRRTATRAGGKVTVKGLMIDSQLRARGHVQSLVLGGLHGSDVLVGVVADFEGRLPASALDFDAQARLGQVKLAGVDGEPFAMIDANIAAWKLRSVTLGTVQRDNGGTPFGLAAHELGRLAEQVPPFGSGQPGDDSVINLV